MICTIIISVPTLHVRKKKNSSEMRVWKLLGKSDTFGVNEATTIELFVNNSSQNVWRKNHIQYDSNNGEKWCFFPIFLQDMASCETRKLKPGYKLEPSPAYCWFGTSVLCFSSSSFDSYEALCAKVWHFSRVWTLLTRENSAVYSELKEFQPLLDLLNSI